MHWTKWHTTLEKQGFMRWDASNGNLLHIRRTETQYHLYTNNGELDKDFKKKSQALKFAKSWMRKHPNG